MTLVEIARFLQWNQFLIAQAREIFGIGLYKIPELTVKVFDKPALMSHKVCMLSRLNMNGGVAWERTRMPPSTV